MELTTTATETRTMKDSTVQSRRRALTRPGLGMFALEARLMFDGAAAGEAAHAAPDAAAKALIPDAPAAVEVRAADPGKDNGKKEVVVVDTSVTDYKTLEAGVKDGVAIVEIDGARDGLAQIAKWAETNGGYDAIHILSHGAQGALNLGTNSLTDSSLNSTVAQAELAEIGHALNADGDLLLYGCNVAKGPGGAQFIANLAAATGADVAASTDTTGATRQGGNWSLEQQTGNIDVRSLLMADYQDVLSTITFSGSDTDIGAEAYSHTSITRNETVSGQDLTLSGGTAAGGLALDGNGLYALEGAVNGSDIKLTISAPSGYTFDITSFRAQMTTASLSIVLTYAGGSTESFTQTGISSSGLSLLSSFNSTSHTINDVTQVVLTSNDYGVFQDLVITDVKPLAPSFTSSTTASFAENGTGTAYTAAATASGGTVTYSLSGTDASLFNFDSSTGIVTFKTVPNYESPGDSGANNVYDITITATDSNGSSNQGVAISVTDVNEFSPTLSTPSAASYTDTSANNSFSNTTGTLAGSDLDGSSTLIYGITSGTTGGSTNIGGTVYDVSKAGSYGTLYVKSATGAYVYVPSNSAINALTGGSSETFTVTTSDGTTSANATYTVNLTGANDTPTLSTPTAASYTDTSANDSFSNTTGTLAGGDLDTGATLAYGLTGGTGGSYTVASITYDLAKAGTYGTLYLLSSTGAYVYVPNASAINALSAGTSETFSVTTSDGTASASATYTVNLTGANDTPTLSTPTAASYTDTSASDSFSNTTGTLAGSDRDTGATLSYGISGGTGGSHTVDGSTYDVAKAGTYGTLYVSSTTGAYVYVPNASAINALTTNTSETFSVTTSDSTASTSATYTINLTGANDTPTNIALSASTVGQSSGSNATVGTLSTSDADTGQSYTYSLLSGNSAFSISGNSLVANASSLAAGDYNVTIRTSDGSATYEKIFTITVGDDIAPTVSSVAVPSSGSYAAGDTLDFTVNFDEAVTVGGGGTPSIAVTVGASTRYATYLSGSGTTALVFRYTIQSGDNDSNGIAVGTLSANGGSLKDAADNAATLTLNSVASTASVLVDTSPPGMPSVAISSDGGTSTSDGVTNATSQTITVTGEIGASVNLDFGDGSAHATGAIGAGGTFTSAAHSYATGSHTISATLTDSTGNTSIAGTQTLVIDSTAPSVTTSVSQSISSTSAINGATVCTLAASDATVISGFTDALAWSITGGADAGDFSLSGNSLQINNAGGLPLGSYSVQVTAMDTAGNTDVQTITVSVVNGPAVTAASLSYTDTAANDSFANQTGTISATANTGSITAYGIGGSSGGSYFSGAYDLSKSGTYGTLYVNSNTGAYVYVPASNATLNALTATVTDTFTIQATDGGGTADATLTVSITGANDTPALATPASASYTDSSAHDSFGNTTGTLAGSDRDTGATLSYGITGGTTGGSTVIDSTTYDVAKSGTYGTLYVNSSTGVYAYVPDAATINAAAADTSETFSVTTSDGTASGSTTYTVNIAAANDAPSVTVPGTISVTEDVAAAITGISFADVDAGNNSVTATLAVGSGTLAASSGGGVTVTGSNSGTLTLTGSITNINTFIANSHITFTTAANATGAVTLTSTINDDGHAGSGGAQTDSATTTLNVSAVNDAPMAGSIGNQNATEAQPFTFTVPAGSFSDPDNGDHLTYSATLADGSPLPGWLTFDPTARTFSGTPGNGDLGTVNLRVIATDGGGLSASTTFAIQVTSTVIPPLIQPSSPSTPPPSPPVEEPALPTPPRAAIDFLPTGSALSLNNSLAGTDLPPATTVSPSAPATAGNSPTDRPTPAGTPAFHVATAPADSSTALIVNHGVADTQIPTGGHLETSIPSDAFAHTDPNATVVLSLRQADGRPLPAWVRFNPATGKLLIDPPPGYEGRLTLRLNARDSGGHEATTIFRLFIGQRHVQDGRASLNTQLQEAIRPTGLSSQLATLAAHANDVLRLRA